MLAEALEHLVRGIVTNPDDVHVEQVTQQRGRMLRVTVHPEDIGKVIGRGGRTADSLRKVVNALAKGRVVRIDFLDPAERNRPNRRR